MDPGTLGLLPTEMASLWNSRIMPGAMSRIRLILIGKSFRIMDLDLGKVLLIITTLTRIAVIVLVCRAPSMCDTMEAESV